MNFKTDRAKNNAIYINVTWSNILSPITTHKSTSYPDNDKKSNMWKVISKNSLKWKKLFDDKCKIQLMKFFKKTHPQNTLKEEIKEFSPCNAVLFTNSFFIIFITRVQILLLRKVRKKPQLKIIVNY